MSVPLPFPASHAGRIRRLAQVSLAAVLGALVLAAPGTARADSAPKPSLLRQLRDGGRIIAGRNAVTALAQPASRAGERTLSPSGRAQAQRLGAGIRGHPRGPPARRARAADDGARAAGVRRVRAAGAPAGGRQRPAPQRRFTDDVAAGSNRVLMAGEATIRRMLPQHGSAPLVEGDCLVLRPERGGRPQIRARVAPDEWARMRDVPHVTPRP